MQTLVAYLLELSFTLLVLSLGFLLLKTRFNVSLSNNSTSKQSLGDVNNNAFALVFMGPISEKELFARIQESNHLIAKGAELFFFIDQPFVFKNQIEGVHIILPKEHYQKAQNLLSLCARYATKKPEFLVLLNPKLSFTDQLWLAVEEHLNAGYDFFELQAVSPFLMDDFESEQKEKHSNFMHLFYSKFIKNTDSLAHHTIVINSNLYDQIPGKVLNHLNTKFIHSEEFEFGSINNNSEYHQIDLERYFKPNFKLAYGQFLIQLNWSIFLSSLTNTIVSKFSNVLFRSMSIAILVFALSLTYVDQLFFAKPTVFYYLTWTSIFAYSFILLANGFKKGSKTVVASFPFRRIVKPSVFN